MPVLCFHQLFYFWAFLESLKAGKVGILSLPAGCPPSNAKKEKKFLIFILHLGLLILKANGPSSPPPHTALNAFSVGIHATSRNSCYHRSPKRPKTVLSGGRLREMTWWSQTNFFRDHLYHCYGFYLNRLDTPPPYNLSSKNLQVVFRFWRQETKS